MELNLAIFPEGRISKARSVVLNVGIADQIGLP